MASSLAELEMLTIMFSLLVFALFTLGGMLNEECGQSNGTTKTHTHIHKCLDCDLASALTQNIRAPKYFKNDYTFQIIIIYKYIYTFIHIGNFCHQLSEVCQLCKH